jgi:hypothetical protein
MEASTALPGAPIRRPCSHPRHRHDRRDQEVVAVSRHTRRVELRAFKREARSTHLNTFLVPADANLDRHPLLLRARAHWIDNIASRRPYCVACEASFAGQAEVGAFLFSTLPSDPNVASVSAICTDCHRDLSNEQIEAVCRRVLNRLWPNGRFLDAR